MLICSYFEGSGVSGMVKLPQVKQRHDIHHIHIVVIILYCYAEGGTLKLIEFNSCFN